MRAELLRNEARHPAAAAVLARHVVAGGEDTSADGEGYLGELRPLEQFNGCIESIAIYMDDELREIPRQLELRDEGVGLSKFVGKV